VYVAFRAAAAAAVAGGRGEGEYVLAFLYCT